ncbi:hypothetical protein ACFL6U_12265 [Planctomycetota bacterium]
MHLSEGQYKIDTEFVVVVMRLENSLCGVNEPNDPALIKKLDDVSLIE